MRERPYNKPVVRTSLFFCDPDDWEEYQNMSGSHQAAHRAKLCWAAMLTAATSWISPRSEICRLMALPTTRWQMPSTKLNTFRQSGSGYYRNA